MQAVNSKTSTSAITESAITGSTITSAAITHSVITHSSITDSAVTTPATPTEVRYWLAQALHHSDSGHLVHRLDAVLLVATGRTCAEVGAWFGVDKRTVQRWVQHARSSGVPGLKEHHAGGRQRRLSADQLQQVALWLQGPPAALGYRERRWSGKRLALHIQHTFGVSISARSGQRLLACGGKLRP